jgi:hypothetical protein
VRLFHADGFTLPRAGQFELFFQERFDLSDIYEPV